MVTCKPEPTVRHGTEQPVGDGGLRARGRPKPSDERFARAASMQHDLARRLFEPRYANGLESERCPAAASSSHPPRWDPDSSESDGAAASTLRTTDEMVRIERRVDILTVSAHRVSFFGKFDARCTRLSWIVV